MFEEIKLLVADYQSLLDFIGDSKEENKIATTQVIPLISEIYLALLVLESSETTSINLIDSFTAFYKHVHNNFTLTKQHLSRMLKYKRAYDSVKE